VLEDRARDMAVRLSPGPTPADHAVGLSIDQELLERVGKDPSTSRWEVLRTGSPAVVHFWYRQSPEVLLSRGSSGKVFWSNPPQARSGMVSLKLDTRGRLYSFFAVPPQVEPAATSAPAEPDFGPLFEAAGLDPKAFREVPSLWTPPMFADDRKAFEGAYPGRPDLKVRFEAASWRGRPVAFYPVSEWTRPEREGPVQVTTSFEAGRFILALLSVSLFVSAVLLARHNLRTGRADRTGSTRLALGALLLGALSWTAGAHHVGFRVEELGLFIQGMGHALFLACVIWLFYVATEPLVRRLWPHALISWTRLLTNGIGDALVARDLLAGSVLGTGITLLLLCGLRLPGWLGRPPIEPITPDGFDALLGLRQGLDLVFFVPLTSAALATATFLLLVLLRLVLKRELLAASVIVALVGTANALRWDVPLVWALPISLLVQSAFMVAALRYGLLAYVVAATVADWWLNMPMSTDLSTFRGQPTLLVAAVIVGMTLHAFRRVRRGASPTVA
ncbi:MAG TPA: hypothetical protein VMV21_21460, partial [Vicinamibacteria bacterium]|nr:hypothetical protein [Vicinamibacteria bacterium]